MAGLRDLLNAELTVARPSEKEDAVSDNQRGNPVSGRLPWP